MNAKKTIKKERGQERKPVRQSNCKTWMRVVAFIILAVFLPGQMAQAVEYDWRVLWYSGHTSQKQLEGACGVKALYDFLSDYDFKVAEQEIAAKVLAIDTKNNVLRCEGHPKRVKNSLYALAKTAEFFGLKLYPVKFKQGLSPSELNQSNLKGTVPFIAHLNGDHYILVTSITEEKVYFLDEHRSEFLPKEKFWHDFSGYALVRNYPALNSAPSRLASEKEAQEIRGGGNVDPFKFVNFQQLNASISEYNDQTEIDLWGDLATNIGMSVGISLVSFGLGSLLNLAGVSVNLGIINSTQPFSSIGLFNSAMMGVASYGVTSSVSGALGAVGTHYGWDPEITRIAAGFLSGAMLGSVTLSGGFGNNLNSGISTVLGSQTILAIPWYAGALVGGLSGATKIFVGDQLVEAWGTEWAPVAYAIGGIAGDFAGGLLYGAANYAFNSPSTTPSCSAVFTVDEGMAELPVSSTNYTGAEFTYPTEPFTTSYGETFYPVADIPTTASAAETPIATAEAAVAATIPLDYSNPPAGYDWDGDVLVQNNRGYYDSAYPLGEGPQPQPQVVDNTINQEDYYFRHNTEKNPPWDTKQTTTQTSGIIRGPAPNPPPTGLGDGILGGLRWSLWERLPRTLGSLGSAALNVYLKKETDLDPSVISALSAFSGSLLTGTIVYLGHETGLDSVIGDTNWVKTIYNRDYTTGSLAYFGNLLVASTITAACTYGAAELKNLIAGDGILAYDEAFFVSMTTFLIGSLASGFISWGLSEIGIDNSFILGEKNYVSNNFGRFEDMTFDQAMVAILGNTLENFGRASMDTLSLGYYSFTERQTSYFDWQNNLILSTLNTKIPLFHSSIIFASTGLYVDTADTPEAKKHNEQVADTFLKSEEYKGWSLYNKDGTVNTDLLQKAINDYNYNHPTDTGSPAYYSPYFEEGIYVDNSGTPQADAHNQKVIERLLKNPEYANWNFYSKDGTINEDAMQRAIKDSYQHNQPKRVTPDYYYAVCTMGDNIFDSYTTYSFKRVVENTPLSYSPFSSPLNPDPLLGYTPTLTQFDWWTEQVVTLGYIWSVNAQGQQYIPGYKGWIWLIIDVGPFDEPRVKNGKEQQEDKKPKDFFAAIPDENLAYYLRTGLPTSMLGWSYGPISTSQVTEPRVPIEYPREKLYEQLMKVK